MKARIALTIVLVLTMALATVGTVAADTNTPQTAVAIYNEAPVTGTLMGNRAGAYWYGYIDYPGNEHVVTIDMTFAPADPVTSKGVGFNLYGPFNGQLIGSGQLNEDKDAGFLELQYTSNKAERLLLQVFNYIGGTQVNFTITATGLPPVPIVVPGGAQAVPVPAAPSAPATAIAPTSGALTGTAGGAFARYTVSFNSVAPVTVVMSYAPTDSIIGKGVDFKVYGPGGEIAASGETGTFGTIAATFTPVPGAQYMIQVENYIQGVTISYSLQAGVNVAPISVPTSDSDHD